MQALVDRIQKDGNILNGDVLKVDAFITHQVDPVLMEEIAESFYQAFKESGITKVVTIEASGILPAV